MNFLKPICVDLDGTLIKNDVTVDALFKYTRQSFLNTLKAFVWFLRGRAYLKHRLAQEVKLDASSLHYNQEFLNFLTENKKAGKKIFLATACNQVYANKVAEFLQIFDGVLASNIYINLRAEAKAHALVTLFGEKGFIYAGNSKDDIKVWNKSAECILVTPTETALRIMRNREYKLFK